MSHKKSVHLGRNRLPTSETPATGSTADASLLHKGNSDALDRTLCALPRRLGAMTQGVWSFVQKLEKEV